MYVYQNDSRNKDIIQTDGCFFRSALHVAELETGKVFSSSAINGMWDSAVRNGWLISGNLKKADMLIVSAIKELSGKSVSVHEVGIFKYGIIEYYEWVKKNPKYQNFNYLIQKVQTVNGNPHYRVVDFNGKVIFDPYYPQPEVDLIFYSILFKVG